MLHLIRRHRTRFEATALTIIGVVLAHIAVVYELHERLDQLAHEHGWFVVDQLFIAIIIAGILGFAFGVLRFRDLRREISKRRQAEQQTLWAARHDALTGLQNRQGLEEIAAADCSTDCRYAVFSIDLVGFKRTNDLVGHAGGDELLVNIARRLEQIFAPEDVYRLGGDEFLALCRNADGVDLDQLGQQLIDSISVPMRTSGITTEVGANVGYARFPQDGETIREIIRCSDIAMYAAKKSGRNNVLAFARSMGDGLSKRVELENALLHAVRNDLIVPYYQPLVDLQNDKILGFEALARWCLPSGEYVSPSEFIEIAEEAGLITELSEKVLRRACRDAMSWPADIRLAFNLSPTQLADKLLGLRLMTILDEVGLPPHRLELEITESALIQNSAAAEAVLSDLSEAGIKIALDDFGTGYSSFAHLLRFKFDKIKIDRSFVHQMNSDEKHRRIVQSILGLSRNLGIPATAEGIESDGQRDHLRNMGCDFGQGFLFSEAIPAGAVQALFLQSQSGPTSLMG
ncbi:putative bifunctional diguanylate cyclase/phosphodiesterase [Agrobacterium tumefaciens]|uniref:putative bifunctional diguanylate cyclase/phosphodiesterase n=1 Tax=Agrobacterium tumefaciens TaxID=358 RepID=UPI001F2B301F|nr:EAL domain-containing protein [Agrobacterium tumefaciens]WHO20795.1 EAL domain-containing protein [Agrobacterium tumefaciens]WHO23580.1 EAL domain-containing protein [Agrobacterium tumefaciens]